MKFTLLALAVALCVALAHAEPEPEPWRGGYRGWSVGGGYKGGRGGAGKRFGDPEPQPSLAAHDGFIESGSSGYTGGYGGQNSF